MGFRSFIIIDESHKKDYIVISQACDFLKACMGFSKMHMRYGKQLHPCHLPVTLDENRDANNNYFISFLIYW